MATIIFRGYTNTTWGHKESKIKNPFYDDPIWFSQDADYGFGQRTAFLFDRTKNKIEVHVGPKNSDGAAGYFNGQVRFKLQRYEFTRDGWWGNEIKLRVVCKTGKK